MPESPDRRWGAVEERVGEHEGEVAGEDRQSFAVSSAVTCPSGRGVTHREAHVQRRVAPPHGAAVHDVVVDEGERVEQLEGGAHVEQLGLVAVGTGRDRPPIAEGRAQPLAASGDKVVEHVEERGQLALLGHPGCSSAIEHGADPRLDGPLDGGDGVAAGDGRRRRGVEIRWGMHRLLFSTNMAAMLAREVLLAEPRGFCAGVEAAVKSLAWLVVLYRPPVFCVHAVVHNEEVVARFERLGVRFVARPDDVPAGAPVLLSAHGSAPETVERARRRASVVVDSVCPLVTKVHHELRTRTDKGDTVIYVGHPGHDEVVGARGAGPPSHRHRGDAR